MNCKACGREIPENSLYCCWCGERQLRKPRKRNKNEITVPKAVNVAPGSWYIRLRLGGESISVYETTEALCRAKAAAIKAGFLEAKKRGGTVTLGAAIDKYIDDRSATLSPSTLRGYTQIRQNRFRAQMDKPIDAVDWQQAINREAALVSAKTLKNSWGLVRTVLKANGIEPKAVSLPQVIRNERPWLDYGQIIRFVAAARDKPGELAALLALHSLRRSELCALTMADVDLDSGTLAVSGAAVYNADNDLTIKATNKNVTSRRAVPIMIPRLKELLEDHKQDASDTPLVSVLPSSAYRQINRICQSAGLPDVGIHGLRHSFASLAYHLGMSEREVMELGGWSDAQTIHKIYLHLAQADRLKSANKMAEFYQHAESDPGG